MTALREDIIQIIIEKGTIKTAKGEEFITHTYNDLEVVYRRKDMFINVGKLCASQGKEFKQLKRTKYWNNEIIPAYTKEIAKCFFSPRFENENIQDDTNELARCEKAPSFENEKIELYYNLDSGYQEFQGYYVHPKLINIVAMWCSVDYNIKVSNYMDLINEELITRNISFEQKLQEQEEHIQKLENIIEQHNEGKLMIEGEIEIIPFRPNNQYMIRANQFVTINQKPTHIYINTFNSKKILNNFKYYISNESIDNVKFINTSLSVFEGDPQTIEKYITDIRDNKFVITKTIQEINQHDADEIETYKSNNVKNGLLFEIYCSNTFNIPRFKNSNPERIGLTRNDIGLDLLDIDNKIAGQCKCYYDKLLGNNSLSTFFKCIEHINEQYENENWRFKLFLLPTTKIPKCLEQPIKEHNIEIVRVDFETNNMKTKREEIETIAIKESDDLTQFVEKVIETFGINNEETITLKSTELVNICNKQNIYYNKFISELRNQGFEPKTIKQEKVWVKESKQIKDTRNNFKNELTHLIGHIRTYDVISSESLTNFCKEHNISKRDTMLIDSLHELGFESTNHHLGWTRINEQREQELNDFIENNFKNFIIESQENNFYYISLDDIKNYCETNDKPFDRDLILHHIKCNLHFQKNRKFAKSLNKRIWVKPINTELDIKINSNK